MWFFRKNNLIILPTECKKLILLNSLFQGGRLFVGAICVLYFLSFGLQTEDYAWIKTSQAVIFIGLDIPLGYLLNKIGEYKSLLLSLTFGIIGALGYLMSSSFFGFLIIFVLKGLIENYLIISVTICACIFVIYYFYIKKFSTLLLNEYSNETINSSNFEEILNKMEEISKDTNLAKKDFLNNSR